MPKKYASGPNLWEIVRNHVDEGTQQFLGSVLVRYDIDPKSPQESGLVEEIIYDVSTADDGIVTFLTQTGLETPELNVLRYPGKQIRPDINGNDVHFDMYRDSHVGYVGLFGFLGKPTHETASVLTDQANQPTVSF